MGLHSRVRMKKILHWMERTIWEKGRNINPNWNPVKGERINICQKLIVSIVMNSGVMPQSVHTRMQTRKPQEEHQLKLWLHISSFNLPSFHAWLAQ